MMDEREQRRAARAGWPVRVVPMKSDPDDLRHTTAAERWDMMWPLAVEAWTLTGQDFPTYARHEIPCSLRPLKP